MPPYFNQITSGPSGPEGMATEWDRIKNIASEADFLNPSNALYGLAGGLPMAIGSAAKFRTPMISKVEPQMRFGQDRFGSIPNEYQASYRLRNRLGEPKFNATVDFNLDNVNKLAYLQNLDISRGNRDAWSKPSGHAGARPNQFNDIVGRVAEELQSAGFNKVETTPTTAGRTRLYERAFRQLSKDPRLAPGAKLEMPRQEHFLRTPETKAHESPAMRGVIERKQAQQRNTPVSEATKARLMEQGRLEAERSGNVGEPPPELERLRNSNSPSVFDELIGLRDLSRATYMPSIVTNPDPRFGENFLRNLAANMEARQARLQDTANEAFRRTRPGANSILPE